MALQRILYYNAQFTQYGINSSIIIDPLCNAWTVINIGVTAMQVNGVPLNPGVPGVNNGESISMPGNAGEVYAGRIDITFAGGAGLAIVIQKYYTPGVPKLQNEL